MPEKQGILAIVVTYRPDASFAERLGRVAEQADSVLIVDNHSDAPEISMLRELSSRRNVRLILNSENLGVATALNIGIRHAWGQDYRWVATFDQDSLVANGYFNDLLEVHESYGKSKDNIAMLTPVYRELAAHTTSPPSGRGRLESAEIDKAMTSGSLIKLECFRSVGLFDESLFIDLVDHEFVLRLMKAGYRVIRCNGCTLLHRLGETRHHRLLGWCFYSSCHDSTRRYYMARNRVFVYKRYLTFRPLWVVRDLVSFVKEILKIVLVEKDTAAKLRSTITGIRDGMFGRTGKISAH